MKVLTLSEFAEFLNTTSGTDQLQFAVIPGQVMTGDNNITIFAKREQGVNYLLEHTYSKPVNVVEITDSKVSAVITAACQDDEADCVLAFNMKFDSIAELIPAHELSVKESISVFASKLVEKLAVTTPVVCRAIDTTTLVPRNGLDLVLSAAHCINLSLIAYQWEGETVVVIGKGFKEEVVLDLVRFDAEKRHAFFSGIVAGKPIYQRVVIDEVMFKGDRAFLKWVSCNNVDASKGGSLWWVRHMGVSLHDESNSLTLKNPHISIRGQLDKIPDEYDFVNNRNVIL
ncbi:hypothetical protein SIMMY50_191 [Erwinia phage vB_EamM_Simmy50]|uniref:Uncharacterized protein n=1 Tax=Erwinia phage vB_EamM_Simmy50 TaxID=1815988 RepID=A0A173GDL5_9CAUD|nr:hypothetical protein FDH99_gp191 [Erwinia phage vB_EamM_Simmy50]ANH51653.1 hypothetical protein SIMMY50_191 [Erwinia phage vB_EamM_Simmy50]